MSERFSGFRIIKRSRFPRVAPSQDGLSRPLGWGRFLSGAAFALDQVAALQSRHILAMAHSVFRCPTTGFNVQHQLDDDAHIPETEYEAVTCLACAKLHLINRKTGKLLGEAKR